MTTGGSFYFFSFFSFFAFFSFFFFSFFAFFFSARRAFLALFLADRSTSATAPATTSAMSRASRVLARVGFTYPRDAERWREGDRELLDAELDESDEESVDDVSVVDAMEIGLSESDSSPLPPPFPPGGAGGSLPFTAALVVAILLLLTIF